MEIFNIKHYGGIRIPDILEEKDWDILPLRTRDGVCTSSPGSGAYSEKILISFQDANDWAKKYEYLMEDNYYDLYIFVDCHDSCEFAIELKTRLEAFNHGI